MFMEGAQPPGYRSFVAASVSDDSPLMNDHHPTNEDSLVCVDDVVDRMLLAPGQSKKAPLTGVFAVFDGHGGNRCSRYLKDHIVRAIITNENFESIDMPSEESLIICVEEAIEKLEQNFCEMARKSQEVSGACACIAVVRGSWLCVANVGDCQAVLIDHEGKAVSLSKPHRSGDPEEKARIESKGQEVVDGRVMGVLEPSRTIGDAGLKTGMAPVIIATPYMVTRQLSYRPGQGPSVLVLATDGIWDFLSVDAVAETVRANIGAEPTRMRLTARQLVRKARQAGSKDDATVVVAFLI